MFEDIRKNPKLLARYIDLTNVKPVSTGKDIEVLCENARKYNFFSVCVLPYYVKLARNLLEETDVRVITVVGFPYGCQCTEAKVREVEEVIDFVDEVDMVMNVAAFKNGDYEYVLSDINEVCEAAGKPVKVIIETPALTEDEIRKASEIVLKSKAEFVKTAVGWGGATKVEHVKIIKEVVGDKKKIKASGGIRDFETALRMLEAGACRLGCSKGVEIIEDGIAKLDWFE